MSHSRQNSPNCEDASIYITFYVLIDHDYGERPEAKERLGKSISDWLVREKYLLEWEQEYLAVYVAKEDATAVQYSKPYEFAGISDTAVAQLILYIQSSSPANKNAKLGWDLLWEKWKSASKVVNDTKIKIMGCSLIFHASYSDGITSMEAREGGFLDEIVDSVRELTGIRKEGVLPDTEIETQGSISLLSIPESNTGSFPKPMIYVALSNIGDDTVKFVNNLLWPGTGNLVENDLIVHKSYFQKFQYSTKIREIEQARKKVVDESKKLLKSSVGDKARGENLRIISDKSHALFDLSTLLHKLYTSLKQQEFNYRYLEARRTFGKIGQYHRIRLAEISLDLGLLIEGCDRDFSVARNAVDLATAQVKEQEEEREKKWQKFAAVIAAALAIPQLVDGDAAFYLLCLVLPVIDPVLHSMGLELKMCTVQLGDEKKRLIGLVVQVFLIVVAALAINVVLGSLAEKNTERNKE